MLFLRMLNLILTRYFVFQQRCFDFMYHSGKKHVKNFPTFFLSSAFLLLFYFQW